MSQIYSTYELKDPDLPDYDDNNFGLEDYDGGDYGGYGTGEYSRNFYYEYKLEKIEPEPVIFDCYTCHYTKMEYHEQGMPNCDDPFDDSGIPSVQCEGLCAKTKAIIGKGEYMISRSCLPNCKNIYDQTSTVECCFGSKCNGAKNSAVSTVIFNNNNFKASVLRFAAPGILTLCLTLVFYPKSSSPGVLTLLVTLLFCYGVLT